MENKIFEELADLKSSGLKSFRDITVDERNLLFWTGLIVPENPPYNRDAFRIEINFPAEYPFSPTIKIKIIKTIVLSIESNPIVNPLRGTMLTVFSRGSS